MLRAIGYCLAARKEYGVIPVVLVFPVAAIRPAVLNRTSARKSSPLLDYACHPWAQRAYIVDISRLNLTLPLEPFVALSLFLAQQKPSLIDSPYHNDPTMQQLYHLAHQHVGDTITSFEHAIEDLQLLYTESNRRFEELRDHLGNADPIAASMINEALHCVSSFANKYSNIYHPNSTSPSSPPPTEDPSQPIEDDTRQSTEVKSQDANANANWDFVKQKIDESDEEHPVVWKDIYLQGKAIGLFSNYRKALTIA